MYQFQINLLNVHQILIVITIRLAQINVVKIHVFLLTLVVREHNVKLLYTDQLVTVQMVGVETHKYNVTDVSKSVVITLNCV